MFRSQEGFNIVANSEPSMNLVEQIRAELLCDIYTLIFRRDFSQIVNSARQLTSDDDGLWSPEWPDAAVAMSLHASRKEILRLHKDVTMIPDGEHDPRRTPRRGQGRADVLATF